MTTIALNKENWLTIDDEGNHTYAGEVMHHIIAETRAIYRKNGLKLTDNDLVKLFAGAGKKLPVGAITIQ
mgnify:CR=1 FL=1